MAKHHKSRVCILSFVEAEDFILHKVRPNCADHRHIAPREALAMTRDAWMKVYSPYFKKIAEWVGPHHIRMLHSFSWGISNAAQIPDDLAKELGIEGGFLQVTTMQLKPSVE